MSKVNIIGRGNVGFHLFRALERTKDYEVKSVNPHTLENLESDCDIIILSVSDSAIREVGEKIASKLTDFKGCVAHTAGSVHLDIIEDLFGTCGILYPLQTFTKDSELNYKEIPVFIEGNNKIAEEKLYKLASSFSDNVSYLNSDGRLKMHIAAVFACNFSNALYHISETLLKENGMNINTLLPLVRQTVNKLETLCPKESQTGPAMRGDKKIIESHLLALKERKDMQTIYKFMSEYIINNIRK